MSSRVPPITGYDEFRSRLATHFDIDVRLFDESVALRDIAVFDSIGILEVVVLVESWGAEVPDALIPSLVTLEDVWHLYQSRVRGTER